MAISTENTYLLVDTSTTGTAVWKKVVDIKEFPDLGGAPNTIDVTTLSDPMKTYINGLSDPGSLEFTANYDPSKYKTLSGDTYKNKTKKFAINFGASGSGSSFTFSGQIAVWVKGAGAESSVDMGISIAPSTEIAFSESGLTFSQEI